MIIHAGADGALAMNEARREEIDATGAARIHARSAMSPRALAFPAS